MGYIPDAVAVDLKAICVRDGSMNEEHNDSQISVTDRLPPAHKRVIVTCPLFRRLAYIDTDNIWHAASGDEKFEGVIAWRECP
jgi:hypothetical protein